MSVFPVAPAARPGRTAALDLRVLRALPFATVCVAVSVLGHQLAGGGTVPVGTVLLGWLTVWALATALAGRERSLHSIAAALTFGQLGLHLLFHLSAGAPSGAMAAKGGGASGMSNMSGMPGMNGMGAMDGGSGSALDQLAARLLCGPDGTGSGLSLPPGTTASQIVSRAGIDPRLVLTPIPHLPFWTHASLLGLTPLMLLGHVTAALAAGWWLRRGEAALWHLLRLTSQVTETFAQSWAAPLRTLLALTAALLRGLLGTLLLPGTVRGDAAAGAARAPRAALLRHQVVRRGPPALLAA